MSSAPQPPPPEPSAEEHGASLLVPSEEAAAFRHRRTRPAEVGRYVMMMLGAVCAAAGAALWIATHGLLVDVPLVIFGLLLVALGGALHLVVLRERARWPEEAHAWDEGIEILLNDGDLKVAGWSDPKLALDIFVKPLRRSSGEERVLVWRMDKAVPACDLSSAGLARLMEVVVKNDLKLSEYRSGRKGHGARAYEIRGRREQHLVGLKAALSETPGSAP